MGIGNSLIKIHNNTDKVALIYNDQKTTYRQLINKVNKVMKKLQLLLEKDSSKSVALYIDRSVDVIASIFACLDMNIVYIPIDTNLPINRVEFMLEDSKASIILTQEKYKNLFDEYDGVSNIVCIEEIMETCEEVEDEIIPANKSNSDAYVIYTSGTTGLPKGVKISYKSLANFIDGITNVIDFKEGKKIISVASVSFDIFLVESIVPLIQGLTVVLTNKLEQHNPKKVIGLIKEYDVDMIQMTPAQLNQLINYDDSMSFMCNLKEVLVGGEKMTDDLFTRIKHNFKGKLYNLYGPTETTVWATASDLTNKDKIDIGEPLKDVEIFILDSKLKQVKQGETGELCIAGTGLSSGYLNLPELTNKAFVKCPQYKDKIVYRTGDLAREFSKDRIEILGRIDNQIKLRGFRIEPEEIENVARNFSEINEVVVALDSTNTVLVLHYTCKGKVNVSDLRDFLLKKLPSYMIPDAFMKHNQFEYTHNNKLNRGKLKNISINEILCENLNEDEDDVNTESDVEEFIIQQIQNVTKSNYQVTKNCNFHQFGIDSINFIKIVVAIEERYNIEFDDEKLDYTRINNVKDIIDYIKNLINNK